MYNYFPELDYYFANYWVNNGELLIDHLSIAEVGSFTDPDTKSVFRMMFDNTFSDDSYHYLFEVISASDLPIAFRDRLWFINTDINVYSPVDTVMNSVSNALNLSTVDVHMLDLLHSYRQGMVPDLSSVTESERVTNLSKMVHAYLDLKLNLNFDPFFNSSSIFSSSSSVLETLYEIYIINEAHKTIKNWNFLIDSGVIIKRPWRQRAVLAQDMISRRKIRLCYVPDLNEDFYVLQNGNLLDSVKYNIVGDTTGMDSTSFSDGTCASGYAVSLDSSLDIEVGDVFIIDYYTQEELKIDSNCECYPDEDQDLNACAGET